MLGSVRHVDSTGTETAVAMLEQYIADAEGGWEAPIVRVAEHLRGERTTPIEEYRLAAGAMAKLHAITFERLGSRLAGADDAEAIAAVQARAWREMYGGLLSLEAFDVRPEVWRDHLQKPPDARQRVLAAMDRHRLVGFALTAPASDPDCDPVTDGELSDLTVDPAKRGKGHGSRLLQAAVDTLEADRFTRAVTWTLATDDAMREFLTQAGWAPDSAHRELDLDGSGDTTVKQIRLHTALSA